MTPTRRIPLFTSIRWCLYLHIKYSPSDHHLQPHSLFHWRQQRMQIRHPWQTDMASPHRSCRNAVCGPCSLNWFCFHFVFKLKRVSIQSEVSQKEKNIYLIWMLICGIWKNGIDDLICKAEIGTKTQRTNVWITKRGQAGWGELGDWDWHIYTTMLKTEN